MNMSYIPKGYLKLKNSERHPSKNAVLLGPADEKEVISVIIMVRKRPDGSKMPDFKIFFRDTFKPATTYVI